jgi:hypothetical protein
MNKALAMPAMLAGLSACHGGDDIGDNGRHPLTSPSTSWNRRSRWLRWDLFRRLGD